MSATAASSAPISANDQIIESGDDMNMKRRKDLIGDCALVEIIHLHDCFRGALNALEIDLVALGKMVLRPHSNSTSTSNEIGEASNAESIDELHRQQLHQQHQSITELESKATARFQVIWSVFRAHSAAEDEFIWPALRLKTQGAINGSPCGSPCYNPAENHNGSDNPQSDDEVVAGKAWILRHLH